MTDLAQLLVLGLKSGAVYALVALGFTLIHSATGAINFAQGEFFMLGGVLATAFTTAGVSLLPAVVYAVVLTGAIGVVMELLAVRPLGDGNPLRIVLSSIGCSVLLKQIALHLYGPDERPLAPFSPGPSIRMLGVAFERQALWLWGLTALSLVLFALLFRYTMLGRALRAVAMDRDAARLSGIDARLMVTMIFGVAAALSALAGAAVTPMTQTAWDVGTRIGVKGFAGAILGGISSPATAVAGGLLLGILETLTAGLIDPLFKDMVALVVLLAVLVFRPAGLFASARKDRV